MPATLRLTSLLAAAVLAVAVLEPSAAAPAAPERTGAEAAADVAYNVRTLDLRFPAPMYANACKVRTIDLDRGDYRWQRETWLTERGTHEIFLAGGRYTWTDCIDWPASGPIDSYIQSSSITNNATGSQVRMDGGRLPHASPGLHRWQFGSSLELLSCVVC
jgi:hypothetical protein